MIKYHIYNKQIKYKLIIYNLEFNNYQAQLNKLTLNASNSFIKKCF